MKEVKKIRLSDSPSSKEVKKIKLEPLEKNEYDFDHEKKNAYDSYGAVKDDLYRYGE